MKSDFPQNAQPQGAPPSPVAADANAPTGQNNAANQSNTPPPATGTTGLRQLFAFFWDRSLLIFLIIGGLNTIISMAGSFALNNYAHWPLFWSMVFMFATCSVPSFYFNRKYSFQSKAPLAQSILRFSTLVTVCFLVSYGLNYLVVPWMYTHWFPGIHPLFYSAIRIVGIQAVFTILNYMGQRLWAFKE